MKPGKDADEYGGSEWEVKTPEETKREEGLEELVKKVRTFLRACFLLKPPPCSVVRADNKRYHYFAVW